MKSSTSMLRLSAVLALLLAAASSSPARACTPARANARIRVSFLADSDLAALAKWAQQTTCVEYGYERALASRRLGQGVILTVMGRDLGAIFEILLHSMNLKTYGHGAKLSIVADGPETTQSREANEREKSDLERDKVMATIQSEIKRKDDSHYTITRRGADALMANIPSIARTMRVATESKGGKRIGYRLLGLKPGNPLTYVGVQNGDVVLSLGGNELTAPDKALTAYAKFRTTGMLAASLLRGNQALAVELKIEP